jgi:hypothetical protein
MQPRDPAVPAHALTFMWEDAQHSVFRIRSLDYMRTKVGG